jgi:hypothetical protein
MLSTRQMYRGKVTPPEDWRRSRFEVSCGCKRHVRGAVELAADDRVCGCEGGDIIVCAHSRWIAVLKSRRPLPRGDQDTRLALAVVSDAQNVGNVTLTRYDFLFPYAHLVVDQTMLLHVVAVFDKLRAHLL